MRDNEQENRETHEAVDDVIESMERFASRHWMHDEGQNVREFAARLKAAWKRDEERAVEHATRHAEAVARDNCRDCVHNPSGKNYEGGNAAAMREALIWMKERMIAAIHDGSLDCSEALNKIEDALKKPARNCDMFGTDNTEAELAYEEYCEKSEIEESITGAFEWLFALAERKGESNGVQSTP